MFGAFLEKAKYQVKTQLGVSDGSYHSTKENPLHGPGQGVKASPAMWTFVSTAAMEILDELNDSLEVCNPTQTVRAARPMDGFVDDTTAWANQFVREQPTAATKPPMSKSAVTEGSSQQSIIGVIYKKPNSTWFFKAKDTKERIDEISASFKNYFVDQLKFDEDNRPIFSHIPESMNAANTSNMRVATYMLAGVEISVSQLGGQQDVFSNVQRWMGQIGLDDSSAIQLDFKDDKKTILVKMPR
jgi:hypothetical protein